MQIGGAPFDVVWEGNNVLTDGDAFLRTSDNLPATGFRFVGNIVNKAGTYGVWSPAVMGVNQFRGVGFYLVFPGAVMTGNTFTAAHSTFRNIFTENDYLP